MKKGLLIVYTGHGKGKTTAGLGQVWRALGSGFKVCVIQFIKGSWKCGESAAAKRHNDFLEFHVLGRGFTWKSKNLDEDTAMARKAWQTAKEIILSGRFRMVMLDELTYLMKYGMVDEAEVIDCLLARPENLHIIVTGRDAPRSLIEVADLVTEMRQIRHHYHLGIMAQRGIEF